MIGCVRDWLRASDRAPDDTTAATVDELRDRLDYAVLELDGLPGYARGWYKLAEAKPPPAEGALLEVWQFPAASR